MNKKVENIAIYWKTVRNYRKNLDNIKRGESFQMFQLYQEKQPKITKGTSKEHISSIITQYDLDVKFQQPRGSFESPS